MKFQYYITLSKEYIGKILKIGIPSAFEQVMYQGCQIVFLYYATYLGAESLVAKTVRDEYFDVHLLVCHCDWNGYSDYCRPFSRRKRKR